MGTYLKHYYTKSKSLPHNQNFKEQPESDMIMPMEWRLKSISNSIIPQESVKKQSPTRITHKLNTTVVYRVKPIKVFSNVLYCHNPEVPIFTNSYIQEKLTYHRENTEPPKKDPPIQKKKIQNFLAYKNKKFISMKSRKVSLNNPLNSSLSFKNRLSMVVTSHPRTFPTQQ